MLENSEIIVGQQFCGPPASGNGGYVCGRVADYIEGCARVRLSLPPPLEVPMELTQTADSIELAYNNQLIAQAWPGTIDMDIPACPSLTEVREMSRCFPGFNHHMFPGCFVCGPERKHGEGLRIFAGRTGQSNLVGCPWSPDPSLFDEQGRLQPRYIWAALDCPSAGAFMDTEMTPVLLGELSVRIDSTRINPDQQLIIIGWELEASGRKHLTASALFNTDQELLACARATWIEIEPDRLAEYSNQPANKATGE
jgi:hypothetical protein